MNRGNAMRREHIMTVLGADSHVSSAKPYATTARACSWDQSDQHLAQAIGHLTDAINVLAEQVHRAS
jgi:hypothetical protein